MLTAAMAAVTVAVLLLGVPMSIFGALYTRENLDQNLRLRTQSVTRAVETRVNMNYPIDTDFLERWAEADSETPARITVTNLDGSVVTAGPDLGERTYGAESTSPSGAHVVLEISGSLVFWRAARVVILVVVASLVAFALAAMVALWSARRLAAPLIYLAASAEQIGSGQVRPRLSPPGWRRSTWSVPSWCAPVIASPDGSLPSGSSPRTSPTSCAPR
ncbi:MAG TPA: hypothetical protein VK060_09220 [Ruania sp.]|nr:hypothetical protein [Ruania sp.]